MKLEKSFFGTVDGVEVQLFALTNQKGMKVQLTNYGGIVTSIETLDKNKKVKNIVLGFETLEEYLSEQYLNSYPYFGAVIGRVGNRISNGEFSIENKKYKVTQNEGVNHLHGGTTGFDKVVWETKTFENSDSIGVELLYVSIDGEEGYPGNLQVKVRYTLTDENEFKIEYFATTDAVTPINLTQHTYFNLGDDSTIKKHQLQINSDAYTETNEEGIPTGKLISVHNTPYDFRVLKKVDSHFDILEYGYNTNYDLNNESEDFIKAGELYEPNSGRLMEVFTTDVGIQLYTGAFNPVFKVNGEDKFGKFSGIALETQHFPDAVNQPEFKSILLSPNETYYQKTIYKFLVR